MSEQLDLIHVSTCDKCGRQHTDGNWLICDDCACLLRAWLKWRVDICDAMDIVGALTARALRGAA